MRKQSVCDLTTRNIIVEPRMKYKCDDCALRFRDHYRLILHRNEAHATDAKSNSSDEVMEPDDDYEPTNDEDEDEEEDDDDFVPIEPKVEITTGDADKSLKFNSIVEQTLFDPAAEQAATQSYALSDSLFANIGAKPKTSSTAAAGGSQQQQQQQRVYTCNKCTSISYSKADHNAHMKTAHNVFTCEVCPQSFFSKNNVDFHMKLKHPADFKLTNALCEYCDAQMATVALLVKHKQTAHNIAKELLCEYCGLTALSASDLETHWKHAHTKESKYRCLECRAGFAEFAQLTTHINLHRNRCATCASYFLNVKALIAHKLAEHKTSPDRICPICGYACPKVFKIKKHMEGHGCRLFTCHFCNANFATQDDLMSHEQKKHMCKAAPKTRYKCAQCNRIYTAKGALEHHLRSDHKIADKSKLTATIQQSTTGAANPTILNHTQQLPRITDAVVVGNSVIVPSSDAAAVAGSSQGVDAGATPAAASIINLPQATFGTGKDPTILVVDKNNQAFLVPAIMVNQNGQMKLAFKGNSLPEGMQIAADQKFETIFASHPQPLTKQTSSATILNSTVALPKPTFSGGAKTDDIQFMPALVQRRYDKRSDSSTATKSNVPPPPDVIPSNLIEPRDTELEYFEDEDTIIAKEPDLAPPLLQAFDSPAITSEANKEEDSQPPTLEDGAASTEHRPKIFLKPLSQLLEKPAEKPPTPANKAGPSKQPHLIKITADKVPDYIRKVNSPGHVIKATKVATTSLSSTSSIEEVINKVAEGAGGITSKRSYCCSGCNIVFKRFYRFQQHQRKFRCKLCEYTGCKVKDLDLHYRNKHNFKNQCITCDIKFASSMDLQAHNKVVHYCTKCSKFYTSITKHSTMYKCIKCGDFECSVAKLSEHYAERHGILHMCTPCNEIYKSPEEFATHKKDVHYCTNCNSFKMNLSLHMRFCKRGCDMQEETDQPEIIGIDDSD